jgi:hypothetical protein
MLMKKIWGCVFLRMELIFLNNTIDRVSIILYKLRADAVNITAKD